MADDLTIEILKQIRDGVTGVRDEVRVVAERVDLVAERVERVEKRLERVENGLNDLGTFMKQIALAQAEHERFHTHHVEILEKDVEDLRVRMRRVEERLDTPQ